ncbi:unnamed protein product [Peronospora effusa]|nr:unnamed protein product [Peronospora effusa]
MPPALSGEGNTLARTSEGLEASTGSSKASSSSLRTPSRSLGTWQHPEREPWRLRVLPRARPGRAACLPPYRVLKQQSLGLQQPNGALEGRVRPQEGLGQPYGALGGL